MLDPTATAAEQHLSHVIDLNVLLWDTFSSYDPPFEKWGKWRI